DRPVASVLRDAPLMSAFFTKLIFMFFGPGTIQDWQTLTACCNDMDFDDYQEKAALTDQFRDKKADDALMIPLLGIAGETGTLLSEFKKKIRDKDSYEGFSDRADEELGDIL